MPPLYGAVCLGVVCCGRLDRQAEGVVQFLPELAGELGSSVAGELLENAEARYPVVHHRLRACCGCCVLQRDCFRSPCEPVDHGQVPRVAFALPQWSYQVNVDMCEALSWFLVGLER